MKTTKKVPKPQAFRVEPEQILTNVNVPLNSENPNDFNEEEHVIEAFKNFDLDGDGTISVREFVSMMSNYCTNLTKIDVMEILTECKLDMKGTINYRDFVYFWNRMAN